MEFVLFGLAVALVGATLIALVSPGTLPVPGFVGRGRAAEGAFWFSTVIVTAGFGGLLVVLHPPPPDAMPARLPPSPVAASPAAPSPIAAAPAAIPPSPANPPATTLVQPLVQTPAPALLPAQASPQPVQAAPARCALTCISWPTISAVFPKTIPGLLWQPRGTMSNGKPGRWAAPIANDPDAPLATVFLEGDDADFIQAAVVASATTDPKKLANNLRPAKLMVYLAFPAWKEFGAWFDETVVKAAQAPDVPISLKRDGRSVLFRLRQQDMTMVLTIRPAAGDPEADALAARAPAAPAAPARTSPAPAFETPVRTAMPVMKVEASQVPALPDPVACPCLGVSYPKLQIAAAMLSPDLVFGPPKSQRDGQRRHAAAMVKGSRIGLDATGQETDLQSIDSTVTVVPGNAEQAMLPLRMMVALAFPNWKDQAAWLTNAVQLAIEQRGRQVTLRLDGKIVKIYVAGELPMISYGLSLDR